MLFRIYFLVFFKIQIIWLSFHWEGTRVRQKERKIGRRHKKDERKKGRKISEKNPKERKDRNTSEKRKEKTE